MDTAAAWQHRAAPVETEPESVGPRGHRGLKQRVASHHKRTKRQRMGGNRSQNHTTQRGLHYRAAGRQRISRAACGRGHYQTVGTVVGKEIAVNIPSERPLH